MRLQSLELVAGAACVRRFYPPVFQVALNSPRATCREDLKQYIRAVTVEWTLLCMSFSIGTQNLSCVSIANVKKPLTVSQTNLLGNGFRPLIVEIQELA